MNRAHDETRELLDAYALGALDEADRTEVEAHLAGCESCRAETRDLERIVAALPETLGERAPSAALRDRVLAAAKSERAHTVRRGLLAWRPAPAWLLGGALALVAAGSLTLAAQTQQRLEAVQTELERETAALQALRAEAEDEAAIAGALARSRASWYLSGTEAYRGSGGWLVDPKPGDTPFVLFHHLQELPSDSQYTIWLIAPDGKWMRATNFTRSGERLQRVDVRESVAGYVQCAVTVETASAGRRSGPVAMQSRIAQ